MGDIPHSGDNQYDGGWTGVAATFEPGDPARTGQLVFWRPDGRQPAVSTPDGVAGRLTVALPDSASESATRTTPPAVLVVDVPAVRVPMAPAIALVGGTDPIERPHPSVAFWRAVIRTGLGLVARGRLIPGVSVAGYDSWRIGPLETADIERIHQLAAAMPTSARAHPIHTDKESTTKPDSEIRLPAEVDLIRGMLDAIADVLPRSSDDTPPSVSDRDDSGSAFATNSPFGTNSPFAGMAPIRVTGLRDWAAETAAGLDAGVRISLRVETPLAGTVPTETVPTENVPPFWAVVQVHSATDPTIVTDAARLWSGEPITGFDARSRTDTMVAVRRAARIWPPLESLQHNAFPDRVELADDEIRDLLATGSSLLATAGVAVHWPKDLVGQLSATAVVGTTERAESDLPGLFGGADQFEVNWRLALGDNPLTEAELEQLAQAQRPMIRLRDQWILVDPSIARKAAERSLKPLTPMTALGATLTGDTEIDGEKVTVRASGWLDSVRARLTGETPEPEPAPIPAALAATLRSYQIDGFRWLVRMAELGLGGCLADDMGLGKTVTLIALHLHRQMDPATAGPTLVVCPATLLGNWEREISRFAPGTPIRRFHGTERELPAADDGGFVLTTYGTMRLNSVRLNSVRLKSSRINSADLADYPWRLVVADEAQQVKNHRSDTAKALREITAPARIALTGTPVENNLSELWAILDWTTPGLLGGITAFRRRWATAIEADNDRDAAAGLSRLIAPFLLRRRKSDPGIAPELPPKTETDRPVALTREQAGLYEATVREMLASIADSTGMARRGRVVKLLTALKQICNHPAQFLRETDGPLAGRSGKLDQFDELTDIIGAEGGTLLVFTQYVAMARLLRRHLATRDVPTELLHGGLPVRQRQEMVERFDRGEFPVFLLSLKAAGTGLNLTRADHVIHFDRWWNPAVEDQATDRAYRIGQHRPVQVHRLIAAGTVEDRIARLLVAKRDLADAVLTSGPGALAELSDRDLATLVRLAATPDLTEPELTGPESIEEDR